jgi:hypothetical protein
MAMRVHVDDLDPRALDRDGKPLPRRLLCMGTMQEAAAAKGDAGGCGCRTHFKKVTARRHGNFPQRSLLIVVLLQANGSTAGHLVRRIGTTPTDRIFGEV